MKTKLVAAALGWSLLPLAAFAGPEVEALLPVPAMSAAPPEKMNVLHLHLTDDQGWRIEIKTFPSKFIHIGGDEAPKARWKACPRCQQRMRDEGLKDEAELQSWFIRRAGKMLAAKGKQI